MKASFMSGSPAAPLNVARLLTRPAAFVGRRARPLVAALASRRPWRALLRLAGGALLLAGAHAAYSSAMSSVSGVGAVIAAAMLWPFIPRSRAGGAAPGAGAPGGAPAEPDDALEAEMAKRRCAEDTSAEGEERFRAVFNHAPVGIACVALDGRFIEANPAMCALLGYGCDELLAQPPDATAVADDLPAITERRRRLIDGDAESLSIERRFIRRDGSIIWAATTSSLVRRPNGEPSHFVMVFRDVTAARGAQEEIARLNRDLNERVGELQALLDVLPIGIAVAKDAACRTIVMNPACARMLGLPGGPEGGALPFKVLQHGRELDPEELAMQRAARSGAPVRDLEVELVRDDGVALKLLEYASPLFDERGRVRGCVGAFIDVTQSRRAAEAVRASEERYRLVARATNDVLLDWDLRSRELFWNESLRSAFGYDPAAFTIEQWTEAVHPDDRERTVRTLTECVDRGDETWTAEYRFRRAGGDYATVLDRGYVARDERGEPVRMIGSMVDLTERLRAEDALRASEERFRFLAETTPQIVWTADPAGRVDYFNQRWSDFTGFDREKSLDWAWEAVVHPDDRDATAKAWIRAVETGAPYALECRLRRADGAYRWHIARATPMRDVEGRVVKWFGATTDIDDSKRAGEALERKAAELAAANARLDRSNQELEDFAYIASHDLKEPLRGIHNYAAFLAEDYSALLDDEGRSKLEALTRLTRRMEALIDSLLYYSRVGRTEFAVVDADLGVVVAEVLDSLDALLKERSVEVRIPRPLPTIRCDRVRVAEVFRNLVVNAVKYNDKPRPVVELGWRLSAESHDSAGGVRPVLYIRDNGIGIAERHLEAVFRIFRRLHARDKFGGGAGSGLTIVKKIVERHGGRIWIESKPGDGATIFFTLSGDSDAHG